MTQNPIKVCKVFDVWRINFIGPFLNSHGHKFIFFAMDYISRWVEAQSLPSSDARVVLWFLNIFSRFGALWAIIRDRGAHFCNSQFAKILRCYVISHHTSIVYYTQTSGQAEGSNRELRGIIEKTIVHHCKDWADQLDDTLWAYRMTYKAPMGSSAYHLLYGKACHLSVELEHKAYWPTKFLNFDLNLVAVKRKLYLNELDEWRTLAYENPRLYKDKIKVYHDQRVRQDKKSEEGDQVLLYNARLRPFPCKLKSRWSRSYMITKVSSHGAIELYHLEKRQFKVNGHRIKPYFGKTSMFQTSTDGMTFCFESP